MTTNIPYAANVKTAYISLVRCTVIKRGGCTINARKQFAVKEAKFLENFVCVWNVQGCSVLPPQHMHCMWYGLLLMSYVSAQY